MSGAIVLTGATSGFGAAALKHIVAESDAPLIVGARSPEQVTGLYGKRVNALPLDLQSLESVRAFCKEIEGVSIGVLGLNAGITPSKINMTEDGYERTFQVNYLAHFLMFQLLQEQLSENALVVTTGSGTHDPEEKAPPPTPRHANAEWLAFPHRDPNRDRIGSRAAGRAYTASKLCCILMAQQIARRFPSLQALSFDPGFLPETNLAREFPPLAAAIIKRIIPFTMPRDRTGSIATTAPAYAQLLLSGVTPSKNGAYLAMRGGKPVDAEVSELARAPGLGETLWEDSLKVLSVRET
ncbi:MAG: SDR family NAD(P)-dependent oxidoreductase [Pseudomonadota bacterium]